MCAAQGWADAGGLPPDGSDGWRSKQLQPSYQTSILPLRSTHEVCSLGGDRRRPVGGQRRFGEASLGRKTKARQVALSTEPQEKIEGRDSQMAFPATVHVHFDNVNSESCQTFLAYLDREQYKYDVETGKSIDVRRSMKRRIVTGEPKIVTGEMQ